MPTSFEPAVIPDRRNMSPPQPKGLLNPYFQILLGALLATASEIFLKKGAVQTVASVGYPEWMSISAFGSSLVWVAILCYLGSFGAWLHVLRFVPLNIAFNLSNVVHVFVPLACWIFLGEEISEMRWFGISLVLLGIAVIAKPLVRIEEKL